MSPISPQCRPAEIVHYSEVVNEDNAHYPHSDELLSIGAPVGRALGLTRIGLHVERVPPGRRTSLPHAESEEEEFIYVIEGNPQVWIDGDVFDLVPGDVVGFPAGTGRAHTFLNNSESDALLLVGGETSKSANRIHYPLNPEQNEWTKNKGRYWEACPAHDLGPHDGLPDQQRAKVAARASNEL